MLDFDDIEETEAARLEAGEVLAHHQYIGTWLRRRGATCFEISLNNSGQLMYKELFLSGRCVSGTLGPGPSGEGFQAELRHSGGIVYGSVRLQLLRKPGRMKTSFRKTEQRWGPEALARLDSEEAPGLPAAAKEQGTNAAKPSPRRAVRKGAFSSKWERRTQGPQMEQQAPEAAPGGAAQAEEPPVLAGEKGKEAQSEEPPVLAGEKGKEAQPETLPVRVSTSTQTETLDEGAPPKPEDPPADAPQSASGDSRQEAEAATPAAAGPASAPAPEGAPAEGEPDSGAAAVPKAAAAAKEEEEEEEEAPAAAGTPASTAGFTSGLAEAAPAPKWKESVEHAVQAGEQPPVAPSGDLPAKEKPREERAREDEGKAREKAQEDGTRKSSHTKARAKGRKAEEEEQMGMDEIEQNWNELQQLEVLFMQKKMELRRTIESGAQVGAARPRSRRRAGARSRSASTRCI